LLSRPYAAFVVVLSRAIIEAVEEAMRSPEVLVERAITELRTAVPEYAHVTDEEMRNGLRRNVRIALVRWRETRNYTHAELDELTDAVALRARQGVPLETVLHAFRVVDQTVFDAVGASSRDKGAVDSDVIAAWSHRWEGSETLFRAVARRHRESELEVARDAQERLSLALQDLLLGNLTETEIHEAAARLDLPTNGTYWVWFADLTTDREALQRTLAGGKTHPPDAAFAARGSQLMGLTAIPPPPRLDGLAGLAGPVNVTGAAGALADAKSARDAAAAFGLSGIHTVASLGLRAAVWLQPATGEAIRAKYCDRLASLGPLAEDVLDTVKAHLALGGHRSQVAQELHLHPNTVSWRLKRFTQCAHVDLAEAETIAELWWLFRHLEVLESTHTSDPDGPSP
jgi:hypothetical protein